MKRLNILSILPSGVDLLLVLVLTCTISGCAAPVTVTKVDMVAGYQDINANALNGGDLSTETKVILHRFALEVRFEQEPFNVIALLHKKMFEDKRRELQYALSELSLYYGKKLEMQSQFESSNTLTPTYGPRPEKKYPGSAADYYLMSAMYAYQYLLGTVLAEPPVAYDRRFRVACDLYGYALGKAFATGEGGRLEFRDGTRQLPVAQIAISIDQSSLEWPIDGFKEFLPANNYQVHGLSVRGRKPGLGLPLIAILKRNQLLPGEPAIPVTAFLRTTGYEIGDEQDSGSASLEFYSGFDEAEVTVGTQKIPLEVDFTAPLAYKLDDPLVWMQLGLQRFFTSSEPQPALVQAQPYQPGRIPVVFVHGTASSPLWWAEMLNTLRYDTVLRKRCQFWFFMYNSNVPTLVSAEALRETLVDRVHNLDPAGKDPALQNMVVIGHSQGGLLTKLTAVKPGNKLWSVLSDKTPDQMKLTPEVRQLVKQVFFFQPVPMVKRVVFIATPHRGSFRASGWVRGLMRSLVSLPGDFVLKSSNFLLQTKESLKLPSEFGGRIPTSVDSMSPTNPILLALADLPVVSGVKENSIIAFNGEGDYHTGNDGVVEYKSAHLDNVESEYIVHSPHSCQGNPLTIEEVRRILLEHLESVRK